MCNSTKIVSQPTCVRSLGRFLATISLTSVMGLLLVGCGSDDNRVPSDDVIKHARADQLKKIESSGMPEETKKQFESHLGGPPTASPGAEAAKAHGVNLAPGARGN